MAHSEPGKPKSIIQAFANCTTYCMKSSKKKHKITNTDTHNLCKK